MISVIVSQGAQEIFNLLPHTFVKPGELPELFEKVSLVLFPPIKPVPSNLISWDCPLPVLFAISG